MGLQLTTFKDWRRTSVRPACAAPPQAPAEAHTSQWAQVNQDIFMAFCAVLEPIDLARMACVTRGWRQNLDDVGLWRAQAQKLDWPAANTLSDAKAACQDAYQAAANLSARRMVSRHERVIIEQCYSGKKISPDLQHIAFYDQLTRDPHLHRDPARRLLVIDMGYTQPVVDRLYPHQIRNVEWSPDGRRVGLICRDSSVHILSITASCGPIAFNNQDSDGQPYHFGAGEQHWCPASDALAIRFDPSGDAPIAIVSARGDAPVTYIDHATVFVHLAWAPEGRRLASCGEDCCLRVTSTQQGGTLMSWNNDEALRCSAWSPDGQRLAFLSSPSTLRVMDVAQELVLTKVALDFSCPDQMAWSPDGVSIAAAGFAVGSCYWVAVVQACDGKQVAVARHREVSRCQLWWSPDSMRLATGSSDKKVNLIDTRSGSVIDHPIAHEHQRCDHLAWSPDSKKMVLSSELSAMEVMDAEGGTLWQGHGQDPFWTLHGTAIVSFDRTFWRPSTVIRIDNFSFRSEDILMRLTSFISKDVQQLGDIEFLGPRQ